MKTLFSLFLTAVVLHSFSQTSDLSKVDAFKTFDSNEMIGNGYVVASLKRGYKVIGTSYFLDDLLPGKVKMFKNDEYIEGVEVRYNIFYEVLQVKAHGVFFAAQNDLISDFVINTNDRDYHFYNSAPFAGDLLPAGYIRALYTGDEIFIFAKDQKKEKKTEPTEAYSKVSENTLEYLGQIDYYGYVKSSGDFFEIKSKKKLMERFPKLKNFGNISKGDLKNEDFLSRMGVFLNE